MAVSPEPGRRRRYVRAELSAPLALTPQRLRLLQYVEAYGLISLPQLAALGGLSSKAARRAMRALFDAELVEVLPVHRVALASPTVVDDASLLYGSAPNVYRPTRLGWQVLHRLGLAESAWTERRYGVRNSLFIAHELLVREVRVWLELVARRYGGHHLERWHDGGEAEIQLQRRQPPSQVRPDAWFIYRPGERALVGLVEVDRGTERGATRWLGKLQAYRALFEGDALHALTGYRKGRVLVVTPDARRREHLADFIARHAEAPLASRFWLAEHATLGRSDLSLADWQQPGESTLKPLLSEEFLSRPQDEQQEEGG